MSADGFDGVPSLFNPPPNAGNAAGGASSGGSSSHWTSTSTQSTDSQSSSKTASGTTPPSGSGNGDATIASKIKALSEGSSNENDSSAAGAAGASNGTESGNGRKPKYLAGSGDAASNSLSTGALVGSSSGNAHASGSGGQPAASNSDISGGSADSNAAPGASSLLIGGSLAGVALVVLGVTLLVAGVSRKKSRERREERLAAKNRFSLPPLVSRNINVNTHHHRKSLVDIDLGHRNPAVEEKSIGMPPPAVVNLGIPRATPPTQESAGITSFISSWWGAPTPKPPNTPCSFNTMDPPDTPRDNMIFGSINQGGMRDSVGSVQDAQMNYTVHRLSEVEVAKSNLRVMNRNSDASCMADEDFPTER